MYFPSSDQNINANILFSPENTNAAITLTQIPTKFYRNNDSTATGDINISWQQVGMLGDLYYSRFPNVASGQFPTIIIEDDNSGDNGLTFNVGWDSVKTGIYYCIIVDHLNPDSASIEFNMVIEHDLSPTNFDPNGDTDTTATGQMTWSPSSPQTPFYHLIVSDKKLRLEDSDGDGDDEVKGINIIYQAITSNTSLTYREPDPSGFFDNSKSPRLASGNKYYWLLFNNYGNNPALSSDVISFGEVPKFVYFNAQTYQPAPQNLSPVSTTIVDTITNLDTLKFEWSSVSGSNYHIYLYEKVQESGYEGSVLVFDTTIVTGDTAISINRASDILINSDYFWNVTAENGALYSASQVDSFHYENVNSGYLEIQTRYNAPGNPQLGRVNLFMQLVGQPKSPMILLTDESGEFNKQFAAGTYEVTATKEGFSRLDSTITINLNDTTTLDFILTENPTYFTGRIQIPSTTVIPKVKLISQTFGDTITTLGNLRFSGPTSEYTFRSNVEAGDWTIFPVAEGFQAVVGDTADTTINFGDYLELPIFDLQPIPSQIIVDVEDDSGFTVTDFELTFEKGANQQIVFVTNPPYYFTAEPGTWIVTINKSGYFSQSEQYEVEVFESQDTPLNIIMIRGGDIRGTTYDDSGLPLDLVSIDAIPQNATARLAQTISDINGLYGPLILKPGDYQILAQKNGYTSADTFITVTSLQTINYNPVLRENKSFVDGIVSDSSGAPVLGARVNYLYDMGSGFSGATDSTGAFLLSVPSNITVKVYATKSGWSTSDTVTVTIPENQTETHNFTIYELNSFITGKVQTIDNSMLVPMTDVLLSAIDTTTGQITYLDTTDLNGDYKVFVDGGTFWVRAEKQNYITQQDTVTLINGDSAVVNFIMDKNFGSVSGIVLTNNSDPVVSHEVTARRSSTGGLLRDTTDASGLYSFTGLEPGEVYDISTNKIRHFTNPSEGYTYLVLSGIDTSGFDFTLTRAQITSIEIVDVSNLMRLPNSENTQFTYRAYEGTQQVDIEPPLWTIGYPDTLLFETAKFSSISNGLFEPKIESLDAGFTITVADTANGGGIQTTVSGFSIYSNLNRSFFVNNNIELKDHTGFVLIVDSTDIDANTGIRINLSRKIVPESKAISSEAESYGNSYNITTEVSSFLDQVILKLPIPIEVSTSVIENRSQGINVGMWNDNFLEWEILANSDLQTLPYYAVSNTTSGVGEYIVLITSQPLGIHNLKILPNPFSPNLINMNDPLGRGLTGQVISFDLTSLDIRQPFVTVKIYNMNGELVRQLADQEPLTKGQVALIWDGKANNGALARNGRYIVHLKVKDSTGEKEKIKSSVLVK